MSKIKQVKIFSCSAKDFFSTLIDFESHPTFVDGLSSIEVLEKSDSYAKVRYHVNLFKDIKYTLELKWKDSNLLTWSFVSGDFFKENSGAWKIVEKSENEIEVTYTASMKIKGFVPSFVTNKVVKSNLPEMMESYYKFTIKDQ